MQDVYREEDADAILLADASNAVNRLNREACLRNIRHICPSIAPAVINTYRQPSRLFVDGECLLSCEGTTQGDPLAMPVYALGVLPLIKKVAVPGAKQGWYADDAAAGGKLTPVRQWWDNLVSHGPGYGYHCNAQKSLLLVKPSRYAAAIEMFEGTGVQVTCDGCRHLGAPLGTDKFIEQFVQSKVATWCEEVAQLTTIAASQPQAAYSAFTQGLQNKWSFLCRTSSIPPSLLEPLEHAISGRLIPAITGQAPPGTTVRSLLSLPCWLGGLGMADPCSVAEQYTSSRRITASLVSRLLEQESSFGDSLTQLRTVKATVRAEKRSAFKSMADALRSDHRELAPALDLASEKGASSWLTCRPLCRHGFTLSKGDFRDGLCLRYGWTPPRLPSLCVCSKPLNVSHALSCPFGGFPTLRHNEVRDITARALRQVAHNVTVEPHLQPVTGEAFRHRTAVTEEQARLDVAASGVWGGRFERIFIDVRVFNPFASSNRATSLAASYRRHEQEKRRKYEERVREVEHASFVPVVLFASGGYGKHANALFTRIASLLAEKSKEPYGQIISLLRCRLGFALVRCGAMSLRGSRSMFAPAVPESPAVLVAAEARIQ